MAPDTPPIRQITIPVSVDPETQMIAPGPLPVGFQMLKLQTGGISIRWFTPTGMFQVFLHQEMAEAFRSAVVENVGPGLSVVPSLADIDLSRLQQPPRN